MNQTTPYRYDKQHLSSSHTMLLVLGSGTTDWHIGTAKLKKRGCKRPKPQNWYETQNSYKELILELGKAKQAAIVQQKQLTDCSSLEI
jgi:hypothetical protein